MFFALIFRNIFRNRKRLLPMVVAIVVTFAVLVLGNGILSSSDEALYRTYTANISGDLSIAQAGETNFTIFGSDSLLIGEYQVPPTVMDFEEVDSYVSSLPEVRSSVPAVTAIARIEIDGRRRTRTVIGVDFERYRETFPDLELVSGRLPDTGQRGVVVQEDWSDSPVGSVALLSSASAGGTSFTLREAPVTGVFRFPVDDELLNNVVLADADTARALNGYVYGSGGVVDIPEEDQEALDSDFDDLFGEADTFESEDSASTEESGGTSTEDLERFFRESEEEASAERQTVGGTWNFLLVSLHDRGNIDSVIEDIESAGFGPEQGYRVRNWRQTVGGNAEIAWYLQLMFNVGVFFVALGAAMVTTNGLVLSVLERTPEIGTMRALGASRSRVSAMIGTETLIVVAGSAAIGVLLGGLGSVLLNRAHVVIDNPYIELLFGGEPVTATVGLWLVLTHLAGGVALALVSVLYPLKRGLGITPVQAMAQ